jgi:hypothetical protein
MLPQVVGARQLSDALCCSQHGWQHVLQRLQPVFIYMLKQTKPLQAALYLAALPALLTPKGGVSGDVGYFTVRSVEAGHAMQVRGRAELISNEWHYAVQAALICRVTTWLGRQPAQTPLAMRQPAHAGVSSCHLLGGYSLRLTGRILETVTTSSPTPWLSPRAGAQHCCSSARGCNTRAHL